MTAAPRQYSMQLRAQAELERRRRARARGAAPLVSRWLPSGGDYLNRDRQTHYQPHHADETRFVQSDAPRYLLAKGGEGGGKSVAGIVKVLERLRRGMSGIMGSPDFEHLKRSLWPEFARWCPWSHVIEEHRYRGRAGWEPTRPFTLLFESGATLYVGGFDEPSSWEGPNVSFAHIDEARRKKDPLILKVLDGRVRIPGPQGEPPQIFLTTTPAMHWLYDYFGPLKQDDPYAAFKADSMVIDLLTADNAANLSDGYVAKRRQSLSETEARVLLEAAWEDVETAQHLLEHISLWDACQEALPPLQPGEPLVLAADAGVNDDNFGLVGVSRHPLRHEHVAVRYARRWEPAAGAPVNFDLVEQEITRLCQTYAVAQVTYDPYQLHQMMSGLLSRGVCWTDEFGQQAERLEGDKQLRDLILQRRLVHDGDPVLRQHIQNADRKTDTDNRLRIVKRAQGLKIDLAVALAMAAKRCLDLNL